VTEPGQEPPTVRDPLAPVPPGPVSPSSVPPPPFYPPGTASVPPPYTPAQYQPQYLPPNYPEIDYGGAAYAPPPKRNTGLIVGIVVGVLVLCLTGAVVGGALVIRTLNLSAGGDPTGPALTTGPTAAQPRSSSAPATTSSGERFTGDLRTLLLARPSGAKPWNDIKDADGKLTLDETANLFVEPGDVRSELSSLNFERGAVMHWTKSNVYVLILLFQFKSSSNARGYIDRQNTNGIDGYDAKGEFGQISGSALFVDDTPDSDGQRSTILLSSQGDIVSYVTMWNLGAVDLTSATSLAVQQYQRLPAS
jgi:hypothetical protein